MKLVRPRAGGHEQLVLVPDLRAVGGGEVLHEEAGAQEGVGQPQRQHVVLDLAVGDDPVALRAQEREHHHVAHPRPPRRRRSGARSGGAHPRAAAGASGTAARPRGGRRGTSPGVGSPAPRPPRPGPRPTAVGHPPGSGARCAARTGTPRARRRCTTSRPTVPVAPVTSTGAHRASPPRTVHSRSAPSVRAGTEQALPRLQGSPDSVAPCNSLCCELSATTSGGSAASVEERRRMGRIKSVGLVLARAW